MSLTIAVCIPCVEEHIPFLKRCVKSIHSQTLLPKEVIISVSNITDTSLNYINTHNTIENLIGTFRDKLNILVSYTCERKYAGENRNTTVDLATCDIISFIDADDIMYSNRLNIIDTIFRVCVQCVCVLHHFTENVLHDIEPNQVFTEQRIVDYNFSELIHFGHPSFTRQLLKRYRYSAQPRNQDLNFIQSILEHRDRILVYEQQLTCYVSNNSTYFK